MINIRELFRRMPGQVYHHFKFKKNFKPTNFELTCNSFNNSDAAEYAASFSLSTIKKNSTGPPYRDISCSEQGKKCKLLRVTKTKEINLYWY